MTNDLVPLRHSVEDELSRRSVVQVPNKHVHLSVFCTLVHRTVFTVLEVIWQTIDAKIVKARLFDGRLLCFGAVRKIKASLQQIVQERVFPQPEPDWVVKVMEAD